MKIVGILLLKNEDLFIERIINNIKDFCDDIIVLDDVNTKDRTYEIVTDLKRECNKIHLYKIDKVQESHDYLQEYVDSKTWVLGVDGDELFDPSRLKRLRAKLETGVYDEWFHLYGHYFHVQNLDLKKKYATGCITPDSRSITKLFNFNAINSWTDCPKERLHQGKINFKDGYGYHSKNRIYQQVSWDEDLLRCLHICFIRRSSIEPEGEKLYARTNLADRFYFKPYLSFKDNIKSVIKAFVLDRRKLKVSDWKMENYLNGPVIDLDVSSFFQD